MAAQRVPESPKFATESEREVWALLCEQLRPRDVVLANVRLTDHANDHEADLLVLMPHVGIVVVEVKGGSVWIQDGGWRQSRGSATFPIGPVRQVQDNKYAVREYVEKDPRWSTSSRSRVRWAHSVVLPYSELHEDFALPDCPRWSVHDRGDLPALASRLADVPAHQERGHRVPSEDDISLILEILRGRHLPVLDISAGARERESRADRLTQEQASLLQVTRLLRRVEVRGGAGSGKTVMALTQARELTRGRNGSRGQRVALLCYSRGLAAHFQRVVNTWDRRQRPAFVGMFAELGRSWGAPDGTGESSKFWEIDLPATMKELAAGLTNGQRFDSVIVDEAQDFADTWWAPVLGALKDEELGGLYLYTDANQRIFTRFGDPPVPLVPLVLDQNLRNTRQIGDVFNPLAPMRMRLLGGEGPGVEFVRCAAKDALDIANDQVDRLLEAGWSSSDVMLLTTGNRHPVQKERGSESDPDSYWRSFWDDDDVFYGHVLGCKGLERRAVVLCVNEEKAAERSRERLYVGLSRATDQLIVVGDPDVVTEMGGAEVARRLGILRRGGPSRRRPASDGER